MKRAIIYCRVSTEEQAADGHHSLSAQETLCRKVASEKSYEVVSIFRDPGKSATNMNRSGLKEALACCQSDKSIKAFLVQDTDRLARNTKDHLTIRAILQKSDVTLISASQPMLEDSAEGNMIDTIIASVNQFQSDITARKTIKGLEEKVRNGGWPAQAPLGYKNIGIGTDNQTRIIEIDQDTAPLIKKAFKLYATGNYSVHELGDILYNLGLRSRTGKKLHISKLHLLLQNPFYIGIVKWGNITTKGNHRPLIEKSLFKAVGSVMKAHGGNKSRRRNHDFLLRGYLFCANCGRRMLGETHLDKRASYYRCHKRGGCQPTIRIGDLEKQVINEFKMLTPPKALIDSTIQALQNRASRIYKDFTNERSSLLRKQSLILEKLKLVEKKWLDGLLDDNDFVRIRDDLKEDLQTIENGIADLEIKRSLNLGDFEDVFEFLKHIDNVYINAPDFLKRLLLKFAWERFEVKNQKIVKAIPTKVFRIFEDSYSFNQTQNSLVKEGALSQRFGGAPVLVTGDPIQPSLNPVGVQIRSEWGPNHSLNRSQKVSKVFGVGNNSIQKKVSELTSDVGYVQHLFSLYYIIQDTLNTSQ